MKRLSCVLLCVSILCGCMLPAETGKDTVLQNVQLMTESVLPYEEGKREETVVTLTEENTNRTSSFSNEIKADIMRKQQELFYFSSLEITQQNVYTEILYALENDIEEMVLSTTDTAIVDKVFQCVLMDHPEIFYVDGYSFVKYTLGDIVKKITFQGSYIYVGEEREEKKTLIEQEVYRVLSNLPSDASDYEKVKFVYETVIKNTEYDIEAKDNQNICSVFLNHVSVCQGYAKAVQYLLGKLQVPSTLVIGTVSNGEGHAWNLVKIENEFYYLDATWGDASYLMQLEDESQPIQNTLSVNYDYLCVSTEEILKTHTMSDLVPLPFCDAKEANYYVREGAYFEEMNYEQLEKLISRYKEEERESVTLKCADMNVYECVIEELIYNQNIFYYLTGENNSIMYTDSPRQLSITFWL
ncbi:MAG: hypothetical protein IKW30_10870 [Lachnospiraceae bacterium]|nr:hypothetical protein [Lachnospiraceae bacterium]